MNASPYVALAIALGLGLVGCQSNEEKASMAIGQASALLQSNAAEATTQLDEALKLDPTRRDAYALLAKIHFDAERYDAARDAATKALEGAPSRASDILEILGRSQAALEDWAAARETLAEVLEADPNRLELYVELARAHERDGKSQQALDAYEVALEAAHADQIHAAIVDILLNRYAAKVQEIFPTDTTAAAAPTGEAGPAGATNDATAEGPQPLESLPDEIQSLRSTLRRHMRESASKTQQQARYDEIDAPVAAHEAKLARRAALSEGGATAEAEGSATEGEGGKKAPDAEAPKAAEPS